MMSKREKQIRQSIDTMFSGLDDDVLKQVILACSLGYSEEEKDRICDELRRINEQNLQDSYNKFQLSAIESMPVETKVIINGVVDLSGNLQNEKQSTDTIE
jgi:hypothetical protein